MNVSLPESLKAYVDHQVLEGGYGTSSEYVRELIRRDQDDHLDVWRILHAQRDLPASLR
jgi:putative addiction module CopG family antidote